MIHFLQNITKNVFTPGVDFIVLSLLTANTKRRDVIKPEEKIELAMNSLASRIESINPSGDARHKIAQEIRLAATLIGDEAIDSGCKVLADGCIHPYSEKQPVPEI